MTTGSSGDPDLVVRPLGRYEAKPTEWLWPERILRGELTVIAGDGGLGKSTLAAWLGAQVSIGALRGSNRLRSVWVLLGEDDPGRVLQARFRAAGAEMSRVGVIAARPRTSSGPEAPDELLVLPDDFAKLRELVARHTPDLLIVDPISAFVGPSIDTNRDGGKGGMRRVLGPLAGLARDFGVTVICLVHLNKGNGPADQRLAGTIGLRNAARNVLILAAHPDACGTGADDGRRVLGHHKINGEVLAPTLDLRIVGVEATDDQGASLPREDGTAATTSLVEIGGESDVDYREALAAASAPPSPGNSKIGTAENWLRDALSDGPVPSTELEARAVSAGIAARTLRRARENLGVGTSKMANRSYAHFPDELGHVPATPVKVASAGLFVDVDAAGSENSAKLANSPSLALDGVHLETEVG